MMTADQILQVLDDCCGTFSFPMLDNGYVYLAATRLTLYRSPQDWALAIEIFGFSPRVGKPDVSVHTFASRLRDRDKPDKYPKRAAHEAYLRDNPYNDVRTFYPIVDDDWQDAEDPELVSADAIQVTVRDRTISLPSRYEYEKRGIRLEEAPRIRVYELCRYLAAIEPGVLATVKERRVSVFPEMKELLVLKQWNHPDVVEDEVRPSGSRTFQQLARVLETGDINLYRPTEKPNTHWSHWPEGGTL